MNIQTLVKLMNPEHTKNTVEYLLMSDDEKLNKYQVLSYDPRNNILLTFCLPDGEEQIITNVQIRRDDEHDSIVIFTNGSNSPLTFELNQQLSIRAYQHVNVR